MACEKDEILYEGNFIRLIKRNGWEIVERIKSSGVVIIYPITDDGKLVLVEQFRQPLKTKCIEWPAGLVGDKGFNNNPRDAAINELVEETGYAADSMQRVLSGTVSPGLTNEYVTCFLATGLKKVSLGGGADDENENIRVHEVPIMDFHKWIAIKQDEGRVIDIKVWLGYYEVCRHYLL